jgi:hypothetical protein
MNTDYSKIAKKKSLPVPPDCCDLPFCPPWMHSQWRRRHLQQIPSWQILANNRNIFNKYVLPQLKSRSILYWPGGGEYFQPFNSKQKLILEFYINKNINLATSDKERKMLILNKTTISKSDKYLRGKLWPATEILATLYLNNTKTNYNIYQIWPNEFFKIKINISVFGSFRAGNYLFWMNVSVE